MLDISSRDRHRWSVARRRIGGAGGSRRSNAPLLKRQSIYEGSYRTTCRARSFFARISLLEVILADPGSPQIKQRGERRRGEPGDPKLFPNLYITESNNYDCSYNCILTSTVHSTFAAGYTYARILVSNQCCFLVFAVSPFLTSYFTN